MVATRVIRPKAVQAEEVVVWVWAAAWGAGLVLDREPTIKMVAKSRMVQTHPFLTFSSAL